MAEALGWLQAETCIGATIGRDDQLLVENVLPTIVRVRIEFSVLVRIARPKGN
jgi:hypothetical protein